MPFDILDIVFVLIPMILALTVHEFFHAWTALKLGDDTAARQGRLTLNPIAHIDPIGTLLIPIIGLAAKVPFIGWAKPVPISPIQFTRRFRMKTGVLITSAAGPLSNLAFALLMTAVLWIIASTTGKLELLQIIQAGKGITAALVRLVGWMILINTGLFIFNLLPIPPLDGSGVLAGILPDRFAATFDQIGRYSFILIIAIFYFAGKVIFYPVWWIVAGLSGLIGFPIWTAAGL